MPRLRPLSAKLALETRSQSSIDNYMSRAKPYAGLLLQKQAHERDFANALHRRVGPSNTYNCHGLTFAARRTAISKVSEVIKILREDDYTRVSPNEARPGDIVIYVSTGRLPGSIAGDVEHSGIVVERTPLIGGIKVLSKWGFCDEVVHLVTYCPYDSGDLRYFRVGQ
jgi:hypothetical protein